MKTLENNLAEADSESKLRFWENLLHSWLDQIAQIEVSEAREPIINRQRLVQLMRQSILEEKPLTLVAVGCQDWIKPDWGDPLVDRIMGRINPDHKRVKRFIQEFASFSRALTSLGVRHKIHFSLSDIEALLHSHLKNMGLTIHNPDLNVLWENVDTLQRALADQGIPIEAFSHSQVLRQLTQIDDLAEYQRQITGLEAPSYRTFLDHQYEFDLQHTAPHFMTEDSLGPVWLDIQSFNFKDDVVSLDLAAKKVAPEMPILSLFPNAGNWRAKANPQAVFPQKNDFLAQLIGAVPLPNNPAEWFKKLHRAKDENVLALLKNIVDDEVNLKSGQAKTLLVRLFCMLAFGFDPLEQESHA